MIIIGAGMAGLLAANMLASHSPVVKEKQISLPNNHSAVLRFRSSIVGDVLNIPFKKVSMLKTSVPWRNPVADALAYAKKNGGSYRSDRSITAGMVHEDRWIAPRDLIAQMASGVQVKFSSPVESPEGITISTIPMPELMKLLDYRHSIKFEYRSGFNITARVKNCDAYVSLLVPNPLLNFSRISLMGDELIVECPDYNTDFNIALNLLGIENSEISDIEQHEQKYAKINPIDNEERKKFMFWATDRHNVFSLGRFATWRPGLLLDDLVQDVRLIERWAMNRYDMARTR